MGPSIPWTDQVLGGSISVISEVTFAEVGGVGGVGEDVLRWPGDLDRRDERGHGSGRHPIGVPAHDAGPAAVGAQLVPLVFPAFAVALEVAVLEVDAGAVR
jgi:hypothetical protein